MRTSFIFITCFIMGCISKTAERRYIEYIENPRKNITQQIKIGSVETTVKWLPDEYRNLCWSRDRSDSGADDPFYYFNAKFELTDMNDEKLTKDKELYLDFDMQRDFVLLLGKDSIYPSICQKIQSGISSSYQYLLAFDKKQLDGDFSLFYKDKIFGIGTIAFLYKEAELKKIPKLKA
jgi:hypothetical protein